MTELKVQSFNLWLGGACVHDGGRKISQVWRDYPADIRLLQETSFELARNESRALELQHAQQGFDTAIVSPHRVELIATDTEPFATAAWVYVHGAKLLVWSVHLDPHDYGPYASLAGRDHAEVLDQTHEKRRLEQILQVLEITETLLAGLDIPVIIGGDFNSPATVDWQTRSDRPSVHWPPIDALTNAGYSDAFREIWPDAVVAPGDTWSPIEPLDKEPRDRIDFVFTKGFVAREAVIRGCTVEELTDPSFQDYGGKCELIPEHESNAYPSDHQIVEVVIEIM